VDMDISMDIHGKSVDMNMDINGKFHIHGKSADHVIHAPASVHNLLQMINALNILNFLTIYQLHPKLCSLRDLDPVS